MTSRPLVLLVGVATGIVVEARAALEDEAEVVTALPPALAAYTVERSPARRPTVVVLGPEVTAPAGLVQLLRPDAVTLTVLVLATPALEAELGELPLLSGQHVQRLPAEHAARLAPAIRSILAEMRRRDTYAAVRAAAQRQLSSSVGITRQLGEHLFGEFLTQAPIGAIMLDDAGGLAAWNRKAAALLILDEPQALGLPLADLFPAEMREHLRLHLRSTAEPEVFERHDTQGAPWALRLATQKVSDAHGTERILVLVEDVTDQVEARRRLRISTNHALLRADIAAAVRTDSPMAAQLGQCAEAIVTRLDLACARIWTLRSGPGLLEPAAEARSAAVGDAHLAAHVRFDDDTVGRIAIERHAAHGENDPPGFFAGYPLVAGGELAGVLTVSGHHPFPTDTGTALEGVADQIALGIRQDNLLRRLRNTAESLQQPLLPPRLPELPGFDLAACYRPYGWEEQIGGDFYDVFTAPDGRHVLVLGDVCGKGPAAAAITGLVRHTVWAAAQHSPEPAAVLELVNRALHRENTPFCTLVYVLLQPSRAGESAHLEVVSAGHPAPLRRNADGMTSLVNTSGPLLGVLDEVEYPITALELPPGDALVLYTDGFTEGAGRHDQRESEDLADALAQALPAPASPSPRPGEDIVTALVTNAQTRWGNKIRDDLAVLAVTSL